MASKAALIGKLAWVALKVLLLAWAILLALLGPVLMAIGYFLFRLMEAN